MTNQEAIKVLCWPDKQEVPISLWNEAIEMAISALEAQELSKNSPKLDKENGDLQPTCNQLAKDTNVPCKDTISRQAAIDVCDNAIDLWHGQLGEGIVIAVKKKIEELPSVQPEREKGEWTKDCACEICGFKPWYERDIHTLSFCPNCGADMRGDSNE